MTNVDELRALRALPEEWVSGDTCWTRYGAGKMAVVNSALGMMVWSEEAGWQDVAVSGAFQSFKQEGMTP